MKLLKILLLEDSFTDAVLIERELKSGGIDFVSERVETEEQLDKALNDFNPDLILSDYNLPQIDPVKSLQKCKQRFPEVPFIFVSGAIGEDLAIETFKQGATDYVSKNRMSRLVPAVKRALKETEEHQGRTKAERTLRLLEKAVENMQLGVTITDVNGRIIYTNAAEARMHGYRIDELVGNDARIFAPRQLWKTLTPDQLKETKSWRRESVNLRQDGTIFPVTIMSDVVTNEEGEPIGIVTISEDISDRQTAEYAFYDTLTSLPNRALFMDRVGRAIKRIKRRSDTHFAVLSLDLDRFKTVNETFGHAVGDQLIVACAHRLERSIRFGDTVARLGGDEFAILLDDLQRESDVFLVAERIQKQLQLPFHFDRHEIFTTSSIGIANGSPSYDRPEDLFRDANTAMYRSKALGRNRSELFDPNMHSGNLVSPPIETALRKAIERNEFEIQYQPIVSLRDCRIAGAEALIRWRHPQRGLVHPDDFIPIAEESGLIESIGEWVMRNACIQTKEWQKISERPMYVSVNLSVRQLQQRGIVFMVQQILESTGLEPSLLQLELTENLVLEKAEKSSETLKTLSELGVKLAIDDFGTGYSSLNYLKRFFIDVLKMDRSFVRDLTGTAKDEAIAAAVITLAHSLGLTLVAEGVETAEQLDFLLQHECDAIQGNYFSAPVNPNEFEKLLSGLSTKTLSLKEYTTKN
jgi:diguanylate cyclase (GGDEF)-like protein/PAS domain S-box-containing protein